MYCPVDPAYKMVKLKSTENGYIWYQCPACGSLQGFDDVIPEDRTPRIKEASKYLIGRIVRRWMI